MVRAWVLLPTLFVASIPAGAGDRTSKLIEAISRVSGKGAGHREAIAATAELSKGSAAELPELLEAMNDAGPLARNWLRGAFETIAARAVKTSQPLPKKELLGFFNEHSNSPAIRRLAFEWLAKVDRDFANRTIPESLADPSSEMRRDAVAFHVERATRLMEKEDREGAKAAYELALTGAGDEDQLKQLARVLEEKFGREVDLIRHNGLIVEWNLLGPFDNKGKKGFDAVYPPEKEVDFSKAYPAEFEGKTNELKWTLLTGENPEGLYDIAKLTAPHKGACTYAAHEFVSDREQPVEFRFATPNAWKLWLNGEYLFGREEYHRGMFYDMYQVRGRLKAGKNVILLKVCQNEMKEDWAQAWTFQFRVCDLAGRAIRPASTTAKIEKAGQQPSAGNGN